MDGCIFFICIFIMDMVAKAHKMYWKTFLLLSSKEGMGEGEGQRAFHPFNQITGVNHIPQGVIPALVCGLSLDGTDPKITYIHTFILLCFVISKKEKIKNSVNVEQLTFRSLTYYKIGLGGLSTSTSVLLYCWQRKMRSDSTYQGVVSNPVTYAL